MRFDNKKTVITIISCILLTAAFCFVKFSPRIGSTENAKISKADIRYCECRHVCDNPRYSYWVKSHGEDCVPNCVSGAEGPGPKMTFYSSSGKTEGGMSPRECHLDNYRDGVWTGYLTDEIWPRYLTCEKNAIPTIELEKTTFKTTSEKQQSEKDEERYFLDIQNSLDAVIKDADNGDAKAQLKLARYYAPNNWILRKFQNNEKSAKYYQLSAEQGNIEAQLRYCTQHFFPNRLDGPLSEENKARAAKWCKKLADDGYAQAQKKLAYLYGEGKDGFQKNAIESCFWDLIALKNTDALTYSGCAGQKFNKQEKAELERRACEWQPLPSKGSQ